MRLTGGEISPTQEFIVDPTISWSNYVSAGTKASGDDRGTGIAVDSRSNVYVTGQTASTGFPTRNGRDTSLGGSSDAFIPKLGSGGTLTWSTYHGGGGTDQGASIAVDYSGSAYVS
jgi:hypothetical protein